MDTFQYELLVSSLRESKHILPLSTLKEAAQEVTPDQATELYSLIYTYRYSTQDASTIADILIALHQKSNQRRFA